MTRPSIDQQVTFLYTRDLAATAVFYEEVLALPLVLDQGSCRIYRVSGDSFLGICQRTDTSPSTSSGGTSTSLGDAEPVEVPIRHNVIVTLVTAEVDAWYRYLNDKGVEFEKPPEFNSAYNIYHCFLRDPSGYLLEIQQFRDPTWPAPA